MNKDTVYIRSNIDRIEEEDFTGWEYDEVQYNKDKWQGLLGERTETLEEDNAELWFENIMINVGLETANQEVADLWYQILIGGDL